MNDNPSKKVTALTHLVHVPFHHSLNLLVGERDLCLLASIHSVITLVLLNSTGVSLGLSDLINPLGRSVTSFHQNGRPTEHPVNSRSLE